MEENQPNQQQIPVQSSAPNVPQVQSPTNNQHPAINKYLIILGVILILLLIGGAGTYYLGARNSSLIAKNFPLPTTPIIPKTSPVVKPPVGGIYPPVAPSSSWVNPNPKPSPNSTDLSNPSDEIINGTAYLSPNHGEGMSVQYTQTINGQTYNPFQPLMNFINSKTKITNKDNLSITFSKIEVGDNIIVHLSVFHVACAMGATCKQITINSIQDLSR